jgi:hypothetical protein
MRIWSIDQGKLYTLAYIAESSQYDRYLPAFQRMVDSFNIDTSSSTTGSTTTQVQSSSERNSDRNNGRSPPTPPAKGDRNCDPSYPTLCIKSPPPQLNCDDVPYKNFKVTGRDPHGFDGDNDGIGCDSATGVEDASSSTPSPTPTTQLNPLLTLTPTPTPTDICYLPGVGDWWDNPDCKDYLENKYKNRNMSPPPSSSPQHHLTVMSLIHTQNVCQQNVQMGVSCHQVSHVQMKIH